MNNFKLNLIKMVESTGTPAQLVTGVQSLHLEEESKETKKVVQVPQKLYMAGTID